MKRLLAILIAIALMLLLGSKVVLAEGIIDDASYMNLMNYEIAKCDAVGKRVDCDCDTIRKGAAKACLRGAFYRAYKQELVEEMKARNIPAKRHTVHHFLARAFRDRFESAVPELLPR